MRFRSDEIHAVRLGEKTQLRIPHRGRQCPFKAGRPYVIERVEDLRLEKEDRVEYVTQRTTLEGEFVLVQTVRRQHIADVDDLDALQEGYESANEWRDAFTADHSDDFVWAIHFRYEQDRPRLLAYHGSYTSSDFDALKGEPEAVDAQTLEGFAQDNWDRFEEELASRPQKASGIREHVDELKALARVKGVDISADARVIEKRAEAIEKKLGKAA